jgi:hypothetical protein
LAEGLFWLLCIQICNLPKDLAILSVIHRSSFLGTLQFCSSRIVQCLVTVRFYSSAFFQFLFLSISAHLSTSLSWNPYKPQQGAASLKDFHPFGFFDSARFACRIKNTAFLNMEQAKNLIQKRLNYITNYHNGNDRRG